MMRCLRLCRLLVAASWCVTSAASAKLVTVPTDLNPDEQYRLAFFTSTLTNPFSAAIETYDSDVTARTNTVPELVALGTTWKVIGSTAAITARWHKLSEGTCWMLGHS